MFLVFDDGLVCPQITDLLVNITKHILKPKHQVLSEQAKQRLLKKYSIEEKQVSFETKKSYKGCLLEYISRLLPCYVYCFLNG
jgi:histone H3/H4